MKRILGLILVVVVTSCGDLEGDKPIEYGQEFTLKSGQSGLADNPDLRISLVRIEDSRCPSGVVCIWQGMAKVVYTLEIPGEDIITDSVNTYNRQEVLNEGFKVKIVNVTPYPLTSEELDAHLILSRAND